MGHSYHMSHKESVLAAHSLQLKIVNQATPQWKKESCDKSSTCLEDIMSPKESSTADSPVDLLKTLQNCRELMCLMAIGSMLA
jgi:hypothetical protein